MVRIAPAAASLTGQPVTVFAAARLTASFMATLVASAINTTTTPARQPWPTFCGLSHQVLERRHHVFIDLALERHDQVGQVLHRPPRPFVEFGGVAARRRIDLDLAGIAM